MEFCQKLKSKLQTVRQFIGFLWEQKLWWLIPLVLFLLAIGTILVLSQGTAVSPIIYTLF